VWSFRDTTARYRALKTLQENEERYRSLVIATAQVVWSTNAVGEVVEVLSSWCDFTGQKPEQAMGRGWLESVHPKDRQKTLEIWSHAVATRTLYQTEYRVRRADGEWRLMLARGVPVKDKDGNIREWIGFCQDITDRRKTQQAVIRERDFSEAVINSLPGLFYVLDGDTSRILKWNKNAEFVTEYSGSEIASMVYPDFFHAQDKQRLLDDVAKGLATGHSETEV